jgi:hypothetical protein
VALARTSDQKDLSLGDLLELLDTHLPVSLKDELILGVCRVIDQTISESASTTNTALVFMEMDSDTHQTRNHASTAEAAAAQY